MQMAPSFSALALCPICADASDIPSSLCHNCISHTHQLGRPPTPLTALSIFHRHHPLRDPLHRYKDPYASDFHTSRHTLTALLANTIPTLLSIGHTLTTVQSTKRHNHLHDIATHAGLKPLQTLTPTAANKRTATPTLFTVKEDTPTTPVVILEDAYVTGSTAQSAAHTLETAGIPVTKIIAIGRRINPDHLPTHPAFFNTSPQVQP